MRPRQRNIKPEFFQNKKLSLLSSEARLLFIGMWCHADREGRMKHEPALIHGWIFPYHPKINIEKLLTELEVGGFIRTYIVGNNNFLEIVNFTKHQSIHSKEAQSVIPKLHLIKSNSPELNVIPINSSTNLNLNLNKESKSKSKSESKSERESGLSATPAPQKPTEIIPFEEILSDLNDTAGTTFPDGRILDKNGKVKKLSPAHKSLIRARWREGYRLDDFRQVHLVKTREWFNDQKTFSWLRPRTLYAKTKFPEYLGQRIAPESVSSRDIDNRTAIQKWKEESV